METVIVERAMILPDDAPTVSLPSVSFPASPEIVPTHALIYYAALAYFRIHHCLPGIVAMSPLRLLTVASSSWGAYEIRDYGVIALRAFTFVECGEHHDVDVMICE
jgi:hypothetical protein